MKSIKLFFSAVCFLHLAFSLQACATKEAASIPIQDNYIKSGLIQIKTSLPNLAYYNLQCVDEQHCWVSDDRNIYRTNNSGGSWEHSFTMPDDGQIAGLFFLDVQSGWQWNQNEYFETNDGGRNWIAHTLPVLEILKGKLEGLVVAENKQSFYLYGGAYRLITSEEKKQGGYSSHYMSLDRKSVLATAIYYSQDEGKSWKPLDFPSVVGTISSISRISEKSAIALVGKSVFFTGDGQNKWELCTFDKSCVSSGFFGLEYEGKPQSIFFLNQSIGWMSFSDGRVSKTTNAGKNWCDASLPKEVKTDPVVNGQVGFAQLVFVDEFNGWGLTNSGQLCQTRDGGKKWDHVHEELLFEDLELIGKKNIMLVSKSGLFRLDLDKSR